MQVLPGYYASVLISQAVDIIADQGGAEIIAAGTAASEPYLAGILVNAGPGDVVRIRGITIQQQDFNFAGIIFNSGAALYVENCNLSASGGSVPASLYFAPTTAASGGVPTEFTVRNSTIINNSVGNILIKPTNGVSVAALVDNTLMAKGLYGIRADNSAAGMIRVDVRNSVAKGNINNGYLAVGTGANPIHFMIDHSTAENNGVYGAVATGAQAFMIIGGSTLIGNGTGLAQLSGATVASTGTNTINFNTPNTSGTITPIARQ